MRVRVTETERLIMVADSEGWPVIKEDYDHDDVLIMDGKQYLYWRHDRGQVIYASDNLGPLPKPFKLEEYVRTARKDHELRRRMGLTG